MLYRLNCFFRKFNSCGSSASAMHKTPARDLGFQPRSQGLFLVPGRASSCFVLLAILLLIGVFGGLNFIGSTPFSWHRCSQPQPQAEALCLGKGCSGHDSSLDLVSGLSTDTGRHRRRRRRHIPSPPLSVPSSHVDLAGHEWAGGAVDGEERLGGFAQGTPRQHQHQNATLLMIAVVSGARCVHVARALRNASLSCSSALPKHA